MINKSVHLSSKIFTKDIDEAPTRNGYGDGVVAAGEKDENVVVLCADLTESTRSAAFKEKFPERFIEIGVAEQALATIGSGLANYGKVPFISSYASFSPGRNWEQIRTTACLNNVPVKVVGAHAGVSVGPDGATHQMLEDIALMRALSNMIVISPCDAIEAKKATIAAARNGKPTYLRMAREKTPLMTTDDTPFEIGKGEIFWEMPDPQIAIIATGPLVYNALLAARELSKSEIPSVVVNLHTIKPLDADLITRMARVSGAIVTVEEHQITGGLGGAVAEFLSQNHPVPIEMVAVMDRYGESGDPDELLKKFNLMPEDIVEKAKMAIARKKN